MYGYLNVFVASALMTQGLSDADAVCVLEERDPHGVHDQMKAESAGEGMW